MAKKHLPDIETLRQLFRYEPETGKLYWKERTPEMCSHAKYPRRSSSYFNSRFAGKEAGFVDSNGYISIELFGHYAAGHLICYYIFHGYLPSNEIDHINGNGIDNRILNLREATDSQQQINKNILKLNTSGCKGVYKYGKSGKWRARIYLNNKAYNFGCFDTIEEAIDARKKAEIEYHGDYARRSL